jgi:CRP/FNR family transcriptional regulator, cyclic AMP receptor protein
MPKETAQINQIRGFSTLNSETQLAISRRSFFRELPSGHTLVLEGIPAESCYFLLEGEVRVLRMNPEGRVQVLARFEKGDPINVISLLTPDKVNRATIETLTPVRLLVLSAVDFDALINRYPDFSKLLLEHFAQRLSKIIDLAADLSLYAVRARLARFLIELADLTPSPSGWTQDEIAAHIGTVRDVVGRLLRDFESADLIQRQRGQIILLDRENLLAVAEGREA